MYDKDLMDASCRVALAALLHDLGKFAERARISQAEEKDSEGNTRRDINIQLYCPHFQGRPSHIHAAYTAIALEALERHFPDFVGTNMAPFAPWREKGADDSFVNAASMHHKPGSFLQWVIATADRVASGFEREEFEEYNSSSDQTPQNKDHYTARQITLFEQIRLHDKAETGRPARRYPLKPLSPTAIFPVRAEACEPADKETGQKEYRVLWQQFIGSLEEIPRSHRANLSLWLDHFDSVWQCFTHAIPAATAFNVKADVSLYDHSKTTAALAVALWRYHHERSDDPNSVRSAMKERSDWDQEKFVLIQGDFSGIQNFIFATGGETQKQAAKLLRGRSFYVSLLTECAALKVLEELSLPPSSQVINAAGKFLIVAPNTDNTLAALRAVQKELDQWFLQHTYGQSGFGLAWLPASCNHFLCKEGGNSPFRILMSRLFEQLEEAKLKRFGLCNNHAPSPVFEGFLDSFDAVKGECKIDGRSPAVRRLEGDRDIWVSALAYDQVSLGRFLTHYQRILVTRRDLDHNTLRLPLFGYYVSFTKDEDISGKFGSEAASGNLPRAWDFSLPESVDRPLWNGYARRNINAYVPVFTEADISTAGKYQGIEVDVESELRLCELKTLNHLACEDRPRLSEGDSDKWVGIDALMTLKGDVDNLGLIFQRGFEQPTFAKMAALSRQMNAFFANWLPWICHQEYPNTYTVFAGGDDFFLIGPWRSTISLACRMRQEFCKYVAGNPDIHFSAGLSMTKPGLPIRHLARLAEEALEEAKTHKPGNLTLAPKNSVTCYGIPVSWNEFESLMEREDALRDLDSRFSLSTSYLYALLFYTEMRSKISERPENAIWRSRLAYRTRRMLEARIKSGEDPKAAESERQKAQAQIAEEIANTGIEGFRIAYKIALFTNLYGRRE